MNGQIRVRGMVLSSMPIGEYDRRIVLLTAERGRISAFARGARKPKNALVAATNPFVCGSFDAYEGRDSYTVTGADVDEYFEALTSDLELVWYGYYFLEIAEYFSLENNDETERLILLESSFRALLAGKLPVPLVRDIYEFKSLVLNGDYPNAFACCGCGREDRLSHFSIDKRSVVCADCAEKELAAPLHPAVLAAMRYMTMTPPAKLFSFLLNEEANGELSSIIKEYYRRYVGHVFKSEAFLDL